MPRSRPEPDSLKAKRRQLEEQERLLTARRLELERAMHRESDSPIPKKADELPTWRMEDDSTRPNPAELLPLRGRNLARQRRRNKMLFFIFMAALLVASGFLLWLWKTHLHVTD